VLVILGRIALLNSSRDIDEQHPLRKSARKKLLRRFAAGKTDIETAIELRDRESRIAAQRQRLADKFQIETHEQLLAVANKMAADGRHTRRAERTVAPNAPIDLDQRRSARG
jgi:DNA-binding CsgD family transcriptional regulator